nr:Chain A, Protein EsrB [Edwardsiella piscicida]7VIM_B Chain B, Protein EsrB [Edwardsiella piscicida]
SSDMAQEPPLTLRERQILKLVAEGKRNRDIAELLSISLKTVETHRLNLMRKLDAHNAAELSNWARRLGVLEF